jgi:predicted site-specific integrase-resolvase
MKKNCEPTVFSSKALRPVTTQEVAAHYQVTTRTIANWRDNGKIPFLRITARCFRYDLDQVARSLSKK